MTTTNRQEFSFQAEIKQLLHLLAHSLYQSREIALRELISNASDALDKMRHLALVNPQLGNPGPLEIRLEVDARRHELRVIDNGVGMTRDELVQNLGTIAHSGSRQFLSGLPGDQRQALSLIGQFGVGFYSSFMVADLVTVRSRSYQDSHGWEWKSDGQGTFSIEPCDGLPRGTQVVLQLREADRELASEERLRQIVRKYSSFVRYPIKFGDRTLNEQKAIWVEPPSQLTDDDYARFFQHIAHRAEEQPLWHLHLSVDSPIQFHALLFCPRINTERLGFGLLEHGLTLCAQRIMVQNDCREILPEYLRFLVGLVDSEDLPLNVARETLQDNTIFRKIRTALLSQVFNRMQQLADEQPETYREFIDEFGSILREGVARDFAHREKVARLLRFRSSFATDPKARTSLDEYIHRCPEKQRHIYYAGGPDIDTILKGPNLEIFRQAKIEVLYLNDPIDEFVLTTLGAYRDKKLVSVDQEDLELPDIPKVTTPEPAPQAGSGLERVLSLFREALQGQVVDVRVSKRLTDSPCCLVSPQGHVSAQMEKLLKMASSKFEGSQRILEINPCAPLIEHLVRLVVNAEHDGFIKDCGRQLFANAQLLEGLYPDPREIVSRVQSLMEEAASKRSAVVVTG
jgi:molecular chaperone HtpG